MHISFQTFHCLYFFYSMLSLILKLWAVIFWIIYNTDTYSCKCKIFLREHCRQKSIYVQMIHSNKVSSYLYLIDATTHLYVLHFLWCSTFQHPFMFVTKKGYNVISMEKASIGERNQQRWHASSWSALDPGAGLLLCSLLLAAAVQM